MRRAIDKGAQEHQTRNTSVWDRNPDGSWVYPEELKEIDRRRRAAAIVAGVLEPDPDQDPPPDPQIPLPFP